MSGSTALVASERFALHVVATRFAQLTSDAIAQAKVFILDTIGVGIAGSSAAGADQLAAASAGWGEGSEAVVWGRRMRAPASMAAFLNGFQVHCQEYDCVHERAVLHPMATLLPAALAYADRRGGVSGRELIAAVAVGIDVAAGLGVASRSALTFFRPATSGGFGATAAVARLAGLDAEATCNAFGVQYGQTSGTMQAHVEGSIVLPMQIAFNARAALQSCDLAAVGLVGPRDVFEGPFGYLKLFEGRWDLEPTLEGLGRDWLVSELSHKPFPAGRATHGGIEGLIALRREHGFTAADVESVRVIGPSLIKRLCGRPDVPAPNANYARLCMQFIAAKALLHGTVDLAHYRGAELTDAATHDVAARVTMEANDNPDPNALVPQEIVVTLRSGEVLRRRCEVMLAHPSRRLSRDQHLTKFRRCLEFAQVPLHPESGDRLIDMVDRLEDVEDVRALTALLMQ
ncbi:MmgE/PrpD family protein [Bradyrhizobium sp. HKCCYLS3077]|uniref:MmgE/PrpD family protein n=1 Tax=Bradyrhizobium sp. HKCCYLS3077 TaxID=3420761 RepID=UPI003EBF72A2